MSREIEFRAWNKAKKFMDTAWCIDWEHGQVCHRSHDVSQLENCILMQYTGLKDKNGKEIYEGDIIYWEIDNGVGIESYTAIVKWSENLVEEGWNQTYKWLVGYTGNYYRGSYDELSTPAAYNDALQIIGNIYENPELLGEIE